VFNFGKAVNGFFVIFLLKKWTKQYRILYRKDIFMDLGINKTCESFIRYLSSGTEEEHQFGMVCIDAGYTRGKSQCAYPLKINTIFPGSLRARPVLLRKTGRTEKKKRF
jgi:hypothetical protein